MKCTACGENNLSAARFCSFCGTKLPEKAAPSAPSGDAPNADTAPSTNGGTSHSSRPTARPLNDNPYQPYRAPLISRIPVKPIIESVPEDDTDNSEAVAPVEAPVRRNTYVPYGTPAPDEAQPVNTPAPAPEAERENVQPAGIEPEAECPVERPFDPSENDAPRAQTPRRTPVLRGENRNVEEAPAAENEPEEAPATRVRIQSSPKRVFVFADENEEEILPKSRSLKNSRYDEDEDDEDDYIEEYDGIREFDDDNEFEDDEDDYDVEEDDDEPTGGRIFVRVFSVLTVLLLIAGLFAFAFGTSIGRRLRASMGMSSEAADYLLLADWQLAQHSLSDASESYYNAFKLDMDNYEMALIVGTGFENCQDDARAESLYTYLITHNPQKDEPYDRLMALLNQQSRTAEYEALLDYRAAQQPGYQPPVSQVSHVLQTPTASHAGGAYATSLTLTLDAGGAEIRYTIDGTVPTAQSRLYTGPIVLGRGSYIVRAVAVVNGIISAEWSGEFFIS